MADLPEGAQSSGIPSTDQVLQAIPFAEQSEFERNGTQYYLSKMPASDGLKVFHQLRGALQDLNIGAAAGDQEGWGAVLQAIATRMPEKTFTATQDVMFKYVRYTNKNTSHQVLSGSEDDACQDALDIVEVWVRMVAFNFLKSLLEKISGLNQPGTR